MARAACVRRSGCENPKIEPLLSCISSTEGNMSRSRSAPKGQRLGNLRAAPGHSHDCQLPWLRPQLHECFPTLSAPAPHAPIATRGLFRAGRISSSVACGHGHEHDDLELAHSQGGQSSPRDECTLDFAADAARTATPCARRRERSEEVTPAPTSASALTALVPAPATAPAPAPAPAPTSNAADGDASPSPRTSFLWRAHPALLPANAAEVPGDAKNLLRPYTRCGCARGRSCDESQLGAWIGGESGGNQWSRTELGAGSGSMRSAVSVRVCPTSGLAGGLACPLPVALALAASVLFGSKRRRRPPPLVATCSRDANLEVAAAAPPPPPPPDSLAGPGLRLARVTCC